MGAYGSACESSTSPSRAISKVAPKELEHKTYAPKIGLVIDGDLKLVKHGPREK